MGDDEKERILRDQSLHLFALVGILAGGSALAIVLPLGVVWLLEVIGVASLAAVLSTLGAIDFLAGTTLATIPLLVLFVLAGRQLVAGIMQGAVKG